ncbi:MAG: hypothetical protein ACFFDN_00195 [Candidatus Hodarchaeota archaeon]
MRRWVVLFIGVGIGISSFFILPGAFKFLGFFFSILCFSIALRADNQRFNFHVILISMIIFLLFGSSMVTFDASNPIDMELMIEEVSEKVNIAVIMLAFIVPIILILGAIFAFILGKINSAVMALFYALIIMAVILLFAYIFDVIGIFDFGFSDWILDFYSELINYFYELPIQLYEGVDRALEFTSLGTIDLPDIPENEYFRKPSLLSSSSGSEAMDEALNGSYKQVTDIFTEEEKEVIEEVIDEPSMELIDYSALSYQKFVYAVHDALPLIAGMLNLISLPFFAHRRSEEVITAFINKFQILTKRKMPRKRQIGKRTTKIDPVMITFIVTIMISAWFVFLAYTNAYGENSAEDWRYTIFIYYVLVTIISCVLLIWVFRTYTPVTIWSFIKGTFYGLAGLMLISRLFMSRATFNAFSAIKMHSNGWYAVNTFIFIAPAETICFCVMLPCLFLWLLMRSERKQTAEDKYQNIQHQIDNTELWIVAHEIMITQKKKEIKNTEDRKKFYGSLEGALYRKSTKITTHLEPLNMKAFEAKETDKQKKLRKEEQELSKRYNTLKYRKSLLIQKQQDIDIPLPTIQRDKMLTQPKKAFIFAIAILVSAFAFSSLHWPIISPEVDYGHYWLNGMGVINFSAGCYMAVIAWRYDWCSATTSHAFFNVSTILMVIFSAGV